MGVQSHRKYFGPGSATWWSLATDAPPASASYLPRDERTADHEGTPADPEFERARQWVDAEIPRCEAIHQLFTAANDVGMNERSSGVSVLSEGLVAISGTPGIAPRRSFKTSKPIGRLSIVREPEHRVDRGRLARSVFGLVGLRPPASEHTEAEGQLLRKYSSGRKVIVEIGVAEGASAWEMRQVMAADGSLFLIDPYHLSSLGSLSPTRLIAHRLVRSVRRGDVVWVEEFSETAANRWSTPIDFLFIDGDHSYAGVKADWDAWTAHLASGGLVALHDASTKAAWTKDDDGPVMLAAELREKPRDWSVVDEVDSLVVLSQRKYATISK